MKNSILSGVLIVATVLVFALKANHAKSDPIALENDAIVVPVSEKCGVVRATFRFQNLSNKLAKITAIRKNCSCATVESLPIEISSGAKSSVSVDIEPKNTKLPAVRTFYFYTYPPSKRLLVGEVQLVQRVKP